MEHALLEFIGYLTIEKGLAINTCRAYERDISHYLAWIEEHDPTDLQGIQPATITGFLDSLKKAGRAPSSIARAVASIRSFHRFLVLEEHTENNPTEDLRTPKTPVRLPGVLSIEQVRSILE